MGTNDTHKSKLFYVVKESDVNKFLLDPISKTSIGIVQSNGIAYMVHNGLQIGLSSEQLNEQISTIVNEQSMGLDNVWGKIDTGTKPYIQLETPKPSPTVTVTPSSTVTVTPTCTCTCDCTCTCTVSCTCTCDCTCEHDRPSTTPYITTTTIEPSTTIELRTTVVPSTTITPTGTL